MEETQDLALAQYDITVRRKYRLRGGWFVETNQGPRLLRTCQASEDHFMFEHKVREYLAAQGFCRIDRVQANREQQLITELPGGEQYVMYQWYVGEECDLKRKEDLNEAAANLGHFHQLLRNYPGEAPEKGACNLVDLSQRFARHNRELKHVYSYMRGKKRKTEFEIYAMNGFSMYYEIACEAEKCLREKIEKSENATYQICHGDYNYHNLLMTKEGVATVGFEHVEWGIPLLDLTYFMRKALEKNDWSKEVGSEILSAYAKKKTLSAEELDFIYVLLSYPEKYWKLMNQYMNKKKTWMSEKNYEKLLETGRLEEKRRLFLLAK